MHRSPVALIAPLLLLAALGCASTGLAPSVVRSTSTAAGVEKLKLRVDASGAVQKTSLVHHDAAEVPEAVKKLAGEKFPGAKVLAYESEVYADSGRAWEVEVETADQQKCELSAREDGTLVYVECAVAPALLPPAVVQALAQLVPGGKVVEAESKRGSGADDLLVEVQQGERLHYLRFHADGVLFSHGLKVAATVEVPLH